jgi:hypothetical protein
MGNEETNQSRDKKIWISILEHQHNVAYPAKKQGKQDEI